MTLNSNDEFIIFSFAVKQHKWLDAASRPVSKKNLKTQTRRRGQSLQDEEKKFERLEKD